MFTGAPINCVVNFWKCISSRLTWTLPENFYSTARRNSRGIACLLVVGSYGFAMVRVRVVTDKLYWKLIVCKNWLSRKINSTALSAQHFIPEDKFNLRFVVTRALRIWFWPFLSLYEVERKRACDWPFNYTTVRRHPMNILPINC